MNKIITIVKIITSAILVVASMLMVNSCKDEEANPVATSKEIDEAGGALVGSDGVINLNIPVGALAANTTVSIKESSEVSPTNGIGKIYTLTPEGTQFAKPVKLSFKYTDKDALSTSPSAMAIAFKKSDNTWQIMPTLDLDIATNTVTTETTHFSEWTLLEIPTISSFTPTSGIVGTQVTITGINFSAISAENEVMMNGHLATVMSASTTKITFVVPVGAVTGQIIVKTKFDNLGYTVISSTNFTVETNEPAITSFSPTTGPVGTTVTITGKNFSAVPSENTVKLNGFPATVTSSSTTQLVVIVPVGAKTGKFIVTTMYNDLFWTAIPATDFVVETNEPAITSFSPTTGPVGTTVTITGKNFSATPADNKVLMDGLPATVTSSSTTQIIFIVPVGTTTGTFSVQTVFNQLQWTVSTASNFIVN